MTKMAIIRVRPPAALAAFLRTMAFTAQITTVAEVLGSTTRTCLFFVVHIVAFRPRQLELNLLTEDDQEPLHREDDGANHTNGYFDGVIVRHPVLYSGNAPVLSHVARTHA
jgi:hypothetical protein